MGRSTRGIVFATLAVVGALPACNGAVAPGADGGPPEPWEEVSAELLRGDRAIDCPEAYAAASPRPGRNTGFEVDGQVRDFWLALPEEVGARPRPLLVAFGGEGDTSSSSSGEDGRAFFERAGLAAFAAAGFVVAAPTGHGNGSIWLAWDALRMPEDEDLPNEDVILFDTLVQCLAGHFPIDRNRIYVAGHDAGGAFANRLLRSRSELLAGGIVASGVLSGTGLPEPTLGSLFVVVTDGGLAEECHVSGVPGFDFAQEAALTTQFYRDGAAAGMVRCTADVGHQWLDAIDDWMARLLLAHPKGVRSTPPVDLPPLPPGSGVLCTTDAFETSGCPESATEGCQAFCQLTDDCAVSECESQATYGEIYGELGFSGELYRDCSGCVALCEEQGSDPRDVVVRRCFAEAAVESCSYEGLGALLSYVEIFNSCCRGSGDAGLCGFVCDVVARHLGADSSVFTACP